MNLSELKEKIRASKFHPIPVEADVDEDESEGLTFNGSLEKYLGAVEALGKTAIFIATQEIDEDGAFARAAEIALVNFHFACKWGRFGFQPGDDNLANLAVKKRRRVGLNAQQIGGCSRRDLRYEVF